MRQRFEEDHPAVLPGLCDDWPAFGKWSLQWLREACANRTVDLGSGPVAFGEFLDQVENGSPEHPSPYLREHYLATAFPELLPDIEPLPADRRNRLNCRLLHGIAHYRRGSPDLLIAGRGTCFPVLHYDLHHLHAFITQVRGEKIVWLYAPDQGHCLYPRDDLPNVSRITAFDPVDLDQYPEFANARCQEIRLQQGDTLFIPSGWWHRTQTLTTSIAVTWNLVTASNWNAFITDCYFTRKDQDSWRGRIRQARLGLVTAWLEACEKVPQ